MNIFQFFLVVLFTQICFSQVGINTISPNAQLEIKSSNQASPSNIDGMLIPKIDAFPLVNPSAAQNGMLVYLNALSLGNQPGFYYWDNATTSWLSIKGGTGWNLTGNNATNSTVNFIGTTDNNDLRFRRNNQIIGRLENNITSFGEQSLPITSTGVNNTAFGIFALSQNTTGFENTAIGSLSLRSNTTGNRNVGIGYSALHNNTTGIFNIGIGYTALRLNTNGSRNTAVGIGSLFINSIGSFNVAMGDRALNVNSTGNNNTGIGTTSLVANNTGSNNTALGFNAFPTGAAFSNSTALGFNTTISASNQIRFGNISVTSIGGSVNYTTTSDKRFKKNIKQNVPGLNFIKKLIPVTYNLDMDAIAAYLKTPDSLRLRESEMLKKNMVQTGFIAQDVEKSAKELGFDFSGVDAPKNNEDYYGLRYAEFVVPLVKAVQEQQEIIEIQNIKITELNNLINHQNNLILNRLKRIESKQKR